MKIAVNPIINTVSNFRKLQPNQRLDYLMADVFQKSASVPFKDNRLAVLSADFPKIEVLADVKEDFISKVTNQIKGFSPYWLQKFKQEGYKIILAPTISGAYKKEGVFDKSIELFEANNIEGTLGMTYANKKGKKFFVFCDKPLATDEFIPSIVNHELSHGVINILGIDKDKKTLETIKKDIRGIVQERKLDKLTPEERALVSRYFFKQNAHLPLDEISADICAWSFNKGLYGSGLIYGVNNPNLMIDLFPNLADFLAKITHQLEH